MNAQPLLNPQAHSTQRKNSLLSTFVALCSVALMAGCAAPKVATAPGVASWNGRLALSVDSDPPQSYSAGFDLHGSARTGEMLLASPLGTTLATIHWAPGMAKIVQGNVTTQRTSLDELTTDLGGTVLPVAALFAWLQGQSTQVDGWQADLSRHADGRITARRTHPLPAAELRLVFQP
jgi:outer membrane lipoprotein LolB